MRTHNNNNNNIIEEVHIIIIFLIANPRRVYYIILPLQPTPLYRIERVSVVVNFCHGPLKNAHALARKHYSAYCRRRTLASMTSRINVSERVLDITNARAERPIVSLLHSDNVRII